MHSNGKSTEVVEAHGHLIDSHIMERIFDTVVEFQGRFEVEKFTIGRTNGDPSHLRLKIEAPGQNSMHLMLEALISLGCTPVNTGDAVLRRIDKDKCAPEDFYSTTNHRTFVRHGGDWLQVEDQRMDALVVVKDGRALCRKLRDIKAGDQVVVGMHGIRVVPESKERDRLAFSFMSNGISSERQVETAVQQTAAIVKACERSRTEGNRRRRTRSRSHGRLNSFVRPDCERICRCAAKRQRAGRPRYRSSVARNVARRALRRRPAGRAWTSQPHARHQYHQPLRQH